MTHQEKFEWMNKVFNKYKERLNFYYKKEKDTLYLGFLDKEEQNKIKELYHTEFNCNESKELGKFLEINHHCKDCKIG